jgi:hypothetical protein
MLCRPRDARDLKCAGTAAKTINKSLVFSVHGLPVRVITAPSGFVDKGTRILERLVTHPMMRMLAS